MAMSYKASSEPRDGPDPVHRFYTHLTIYTIANGSLLALNLLAGEPAWAVWPLLGWGIGLIAHGVAVFLWRPHESGGGIAGS
jgi:hypothetical protein